MHNRSINSEAEEDLLKSALIDLDIQKPVFSKKLEETL
jgi:hypothetical protein